MYLIKLASASPRRHLLLKEAGISFDIVSVQVSELPNKNLNINHQILDISRRKAEAGLKVLTASMVQQDSPFVVVGVDTEVIFENEPLGKPESKEDASRMLRLLSNRTHDVLTAITLIESIENKVWEHVEKTLVQFRPLTEVEIQEYIATGDPFDKAGSYGIQSNLSRNFIAQLKGSLDNVMGLPVKQFLKMLDDANQYLRSRSQND